MTLTDWNDLHVGRGLDAVRAQLLPYLSAGARPVGKSARSAPAENSANVMPIDAAPADNDWRDALIRTDSGGLQGNHANAYVILSHDPRWAGVLAYSEFSQRIVKLKSPPFEGGRAGDWEDSDIGKTLVWLQQEWHLPMKQPKAADEAARMVASDNKIHEVRDWISTLPAWDGEGRLWNFLTLGFGADCNEYTAHIGTGWLVSAIARVMQPGCKVDNMLVLEGGQGLGKSTAIRELASEKWYLETSEPPSHKDFYVLLQGNWFVEIGEMQSFSKADNTLVKQAISRRDDKFRAPYDRYAASHPRQCIFVGTTNADTYLSDPTGSRRYLPVLCRSVDLAYIRANRDQLWAEALHLYRQKFRWWDFPASRAQAEQEARYVADSWEEPITLWLAGKYANIAYPAELDDCFENGLMTRVTTTQLLQHALRVELAKHTRQDQLRVAAIMRRMGWVLGPLERRGALRTRFYLRPAEKSEAENA